MKHLKTYKNLKNNDKEPNIKDYVKVGGDHFTSILNTFFKNNIGVYVEYEENVRDYPYIIKFDNDLPDAANDSWKDNRTMGVQYDELIDWSDKIEDIEIRSNMKKYNL